MWSQGAVPCPFGSQELLASIWTLVLRNQRRGVWPGGFGVAGVVEGVMTAATQLCKECRPQSWLTDARPNACVCFSDVSKSQRSPTLQSLRSAARARHWLRSFLLIVTKSAAQPRSQPAGSHATVCITLVSQNLENEDEVIRTNAKRQAVQADNQGRCCLQEA